MRLPILWFSVAACLLHVPAQPLIRAGNFPAIGDVLHSVSIRVDPVTFGQVDWPSEGAQGRWDVGPSGPGVAWDFSALPTSEGDTMAYVTPESTPFADQLGGANLVEKFLFGYAFMRARESDLSVVGLVTDGQAQPYGQTIITFPSTLGDSSASKAQALFASKGREIRRTIASRTVADAYGTLKLPDAEYPGTLRLRILTDFSDSIFVGGTFQDVKSWTTWQYFWLAPNLRAWLLYVRAMTYAGNTSMSGLFVANPYPFGAASIQPAVPRRALRADAGAIRVDATGRIVSGAGQPGFPRLKPVVTFLKP